MECPNNKVFVRPISKSVGKDLLVKPRRDIEPDKYGSQLVEVVQVGKSDSWWIKAEYYGKIPWVPDMSLVKEGSFLIVDSSIEQYVKNGSMIIDDDIWSIPLSPAGTIYAVVDGDQVKPLGFSMVVGSVAGNTAIVESTPNSEILPVGSVVHFKNHSDLPVIINGEEKYLMDFVNDVVAFTKP